MGDEGHKSAGAAMLARALCDLGRFEEAERYVEIALRLGAEDDPATQVPARSTQALVHASRGKFAEAEQLAREAVELYADAEAPNFQGDAWLDLAQGCAWPARRWRPNSLPARRWLSTGARGTVLRPEPRKRSSMGSIPRSSRPLRTGGGTCTACPRRGAPRA
jgi:tetratricopeptide (TPR) repeat protein